MYEPIVLSQPQRGKKTDAYESDKGFEDIYYGKLCSMESYLQVVQMLKGNFPRFPQQTLKV